MAREVPPDGSLQPQKPYLGPPAGSSIYSSTTAFVTTFTPPSSAIPITVVSGLPPVNAGKVPLESLPKFKNGPK